MSMTMQREIAQPYLLFLADVQHPALAKTAFGVRDWIPERCLGQWRLPGCTVDLGLPDMTPEDAAAAGARSLLIGVAPFGGALPDTWTPLLVRALLAGLDLVSGLHDRLAHSATIREVAERTRRAIHDVRSADRRFAVGTGRRRSGRRVLTVGTDCALGKKYTALALTRALTRRGIAADFRATGQTGVMIAGHGVAIDAVVADFIAGAAEWLSPDAAADHWDVIEGQGSLFHPAYAGVTLGLLHGSQPDALVLCHDPTRQHVNGFPEFALPTLEAARDVYLQMGRLTNPAVQLVGISLNTSALDEATRQRLMNDVAQRMGVPVCDPLRAGIEQIAQALETQCPAR